MLAGMVEPTAGEVLIDDHPLQFGDYSFRSQRIRMIFQIRLPRLIHASAFRRSLISSASEYRTGARGAPQAYLRNAAYGWAVTGSRKLLPAYAGPGQKQRLGLARALILRPKVIVADEALASLDMSMRSQLINLMLELQEKQGISYIYVTQHLGMMKHISDQVMVMHREVVERGSTADVMASRFMS